MATARRLTTEQIIAKLREAKKLQAQRDVIGAVGSAYLGEAASVAVNYFPV
jgi:hypothetical protein